MTISLLSGSGIENSRLSLTTKISQIHCQWQVTFLDYHQYHAIIVCQGKS